MVHFPAPKTYNANDIELVADTPVFATSKRALVYIKAGDIDEVETDMMAVRWRQFTLHQFTLFPLASNNCGPCFAKFVLDNM